MKDGRTGMKALQIIAVVVSVAIFGAAMLYSHLASADQQPGATQQTSENDSCKPEITIKLSEHAKTQQNKSLKPEKRPTHDLALLHKHKNVGTMGHALSKEEYDKIQKNSNTKPPEEDKPRKKGF